MSKSLEALERLRNTLLAEGYYQDILQDVSIIEKELKALEIIKAILFSKLKVFETTEKATATTITKGNYYVIEFRVGNEKERLYIPKKEYDLLKEVLL